MTAPAREESGTRPPGRPRSTEADEAILRAALALLAEDGYRALTMEQVIEVARRLREDHDFRGYIHLKTIPDASADLLASSGWTAGK